VVSGSGVIAGLSRTSSASFGVADVAEVCRTDFVAASGTSLHYSHILRHTLEILGEEETRGLDILWYKEKKIYYIYI
jgi:hypothetical protein